jgi:hypothetical protein
MTALEVGTLPVCYASKSRRRHRICCVRMVKIFRRRVDERRSGRGMRRLAAQLAEVLLLRCPIRRVRLHEPVHGRRPSSGSNPAHAALHRIAVTQLRVHPPAKALIQRRIGQGNSTTEAFRVLRRHLADVVYQRLNHAATNPCPAPTL